MKFTIELPCAYETTDGMIVVTVLGRTKKTQIGGTPPNQLAPMLARELIAEITRE